MVQTNPLRQDPRSLLCLQGNTKLLWIVLLWTDEHSQIHWSLGFGLWSVRAELSNYTVFWVNVAMVSPSRGGDVAVYVFGINQPSLPTPFYSVLVSVFMALSTVFHSLNSPGNSPLSHSVRLVLFLSVLSTVFLPYRSFQLCISLWKSPPAQI